LKFWGIRFVSIIIAIVACLALQAFEGGRSDYEQRIIVLIGLYITLAVSLNLINGITGQFSIGHAAFYQVGAYLTGFLTVTYFAKQPIHNLGAWLILMMVVGALGAAIAGLIVGLPSLRLRGDYLAIVTLGFGEIIRIIVQNQRILGGSYGMNVAPKYKSIALVWMLAIFCIAVCRNLLKTAHGLPFLAVREDEVASSAMGVNVTRVKVTAFLLGSAFAGAAGALLAHFEGFITPTTFGMDVSFIILTMVVLGGTGSITGSVVAAALLSYLPEYLRGLKGPDGQALQIAGYNVVAWLIAVGVAVALIRWAINNYHGPKAKKYGLYVGAFLVGFVVRYVTSFGLKFIPGLAAKLIPVDQVRMLIFAVALIVIMLLRPQGIFAHHEFSWSWVRRLFTRRPVPQTAVSA
jgi:branched-chain amino acid transport system permease protein